MNRQAEGFMAVSDTRPAAGVAHPHESAHLHVAGEACYVDDIPEIVGTLYAALGLSQKAHARIRSLDLSAVRVAPGVVAVLTAADIPGPNDCGPIIHDDPILADGLVQYVGQPMFAVVAQTNDIARRAARLAKVDYDVLPSVLTPQEAKRQKSYVLPPMHLKRGDAGAAMAAAHATRMSLNSFLHVDAGRRPNGPSENAPARCDREYRNLFAESARTKLAESMNSPCTGFATRRTATAGRAEHHPQRRLKTED